MIGVVVGGAGVLAMWALGGGEGSTNWATTAGRLTGLEGTYLVLVTVLLLARVWWLDHLIGMDRLAIWHRRAGQLSIWLLVAHAALIIVGYGQTVHASVYGEAKTMTLDLPDMLAAVVGLAVFVATSALCVRAARRRMSYQAWYLAHLYVYLAIALSFAHQFATGNDFATHPLNRAIWIAMYAAVFGALVWYRVVVPMLRHFRVVDVSEECEGFVSITMRGTSVGRLRAESGQFFIWRFLTREGWWEAHPFSLSAPPGSDTLRITVRASGDFTARLRSLPVGTRVIAEGPYGGFVARRQRRRRVLLVAAGAGIAPVRALMETLPADEMTLVYRAHSDGELALRGEIDELAARRGARVHYLVGSRDRYPALFSARALREEIIRDPAEYDAFLCGPAEFMDRMDGALRAAGLRADQIHAERFDLSS